MACVATGETGNLRINVIQADPLMCQHISDDIGLHLYRDLFTYLITFLKRQCSRKNCSLITSASITIISAWKTTIFLKILRICIFMILVKLYIILLDNQKLHKITEFVYFCTFSTGKINLLFKQFLFLFSDDRWLFRMLTSSTRKAPQTRS